MRTLSRAIILLMSTVLVGCGQGFDDQMTCRHAAGPEPDAAAGLLGLAGVAIKASDPVWVSWQHGVDACVKSRVEARRST